MKKLLFILTLLLSLSVSAQHHMMHALAGQSGGTTLKTDLVSVWEFNETTGTTAYDAYASNDGTNNGATINQTGKLDKCYDYDTSTDYVSTTLNNNYTQISMSAWINLDSYGGSDLGRIFNKDGEKLFYVRGSTFKKLTFLNYFSGNIGSWDSPTNSILTTGGWYHVVVTYDDSSDANNAQLYINGSAVTTTEENTPSGTTVNNTNNYYIGNSSAGTRSFDGLIDQTAIWSKILTTTEISALYNSGNGLAYSAW